MNNPDFKSNARTIFDGRYPRKDAEGNPAEAPHEVIARVATNVASVNALYVESDAVLEKVDGSLGVEFPTVTAKRQFDHLHATGRHPTGAGHLRGFPEQMTIGAAYAEEQAEKYKGLLTRLDFLPNSPTWTGAGTPLGQLAACFVLPVADDLGQGPDSIMRVLHKATMIQQTGGGNGFSFGRLRPVGALVNRSMGKASGPMGFARIYNAAFAEIAQGGSRRGANMLVMPVWHPDIRSFIAAKTVEGVLDQFNFSVAITDDFMEAVEKDGDFDLRFDGKVYETIKARDLWSEITENAWVIGDPGNLFIDRANEFNPCPARYVLEATNPCGEQWLPAYSNCCLGSISVSHFVKEWTDGADYGSFDWEAFRQAVILSAEFLDDVVDANQYVPAVPELEEAAMGERRIGAGLMGLADAMLMMGVRYGSPEGRSFASQVTEYARYWTMMASISRAKDRGSFEWIEGSIYDPALLAEHGPGAEVIDGLDGLTHKTWAPPAPLDGSYHDDFDFGRGALFWDDITQGIISYGIRNACQFTFAPTGTISNVAGLEGSGCEPLFALIYWRTMTQGEENITLPYMSDLFATALNQAEAWTTHGMERTDYLAAVMEAVLANNGSCQGVDLVPTAIQNAFVVAADVSGEDHVWMQASLQAWVDNSISKTINLPNEATVDDVADIYQLAYRLGCKGITVYRQGSRSLEVLTTTKDTEGHLTDWPEILPLAIPDYAATEGLDATVLPIETSFGKVQVTITQIRGYDDRPFDVRLQIGKGGNDKNADVEAIGRMISLALRGGITVKSIVAQLEHIGGATSHGFGDRKVRSVADGVAKLLKRRYMEVEMTEEDVALVTSIVGSSTFEVAKGDVCPSCLQSTVVIESGCRHCEIRLGGCGNYSGCD